MPRRAECLHNLPAPRRAIGDAPDLKLITGTSSSEILIVGFHRPSSIKHAHLTNRRSYQLTCLHAL